MTIVSCIIRRKRTGLFAKITISSDKSVQTGEGVLYPFASFEAFPGFPEKSVEYGCRPVVPFLYALFLFEDRYGTLSAIFFEEVTLMLNDWLFPVSSIYVFTLRPLMEKQLK